jgi:23S rRNA pseudouridine2457 synthase
MTAAVGLPTLRLIRMGIDLMDGEAPLTLLGLEPGGWRQVNTAEQLRLQRLLGASRSASNRSASNPSASKRSASGQRLGRSTAGDSPG